MKAGKPRDQFTTEPVRTRWHIPVPNAPTLADDLLIVEKRTIGRGKSRDTRYRCVRADGKPGEWWFDVNDLVLASDGR